MNRTFHRYTKTVMLAIAGIAWIALVLQLYILLDKATAMGMTSLGAVARFLAFFTILTNLLVALCLSCSSMRTKGRWGRFFSKPPVQAAIALYILVVGIVYNAILRFLWQPSGLQKVADELLHVVVPLLFVCYWLLFVIKGQLKWRHAFQWLLYPAVYLCYALLRGGLGGFYPYPFINVTELGYSRVLMNAAGLLLVFIAGGFLFVGIDKTMGRATRVTYK